MKTLLILRHAKSSWKHAELSDHDRPLKNRGQREARRVGLLISELQLVPKLIVCSTATRARQTADLVARHSGYSNEIRFDPLLYHGDPSEFLDIVKNLPEAVDNAMLVGHNPGFEEFLLSLTGRSEQLSTAALALVELNVEHWKEAGAGGSAALKHVWRPRELDQSPDSA